MSPDNDVQKEIELLEQRFAENSQGLVFAHLADAYRRAGEFAKAEGLILHGLKNHPSYTSAYNVLGRVYLDSERYPEAQEQFSRVLELDPHNLAALRALADLALRDGRVEDARSWYERMLGVDPRSEEAKAGLQRLQSGETTAEPAPTAAVEAEPAPGLPEFIGESTAEEAETGEVLIEADADEGFEAEEGPSPFEAEFGPPAPVAEPDLATFEPVGGAAAEEEPAEVPEIDEFRLDELPPDSPLFDQPPAVTGEAESTAVDLDSLDDWTLGFVDGEELGAKAEPAAGMGGIFADLGEDFAVDLGEQRFEEAATESERAEGEGAGEDLVTETMAQLYVDQGLYEDALRVYRRLAEGRPDDEQINARIGELEERLAASRAASEAGEEELAELLELTQPVSSLVETDLSFGSLNAPVESEGPFEFEDGAPVAGLEHLDPFAASFEVLAMKEVPEELAAVSLSAGAGEEIATTEVATEALEAAAEEVTPEPEVVEEVIPIRIEPEPAEVAVPHVFDQPPLEAAELEQPAAEAAEPTIEDYLAGLLAFSPRGARGSETPGEPSAGGSSAEPTAGGSEELEKFQEWLRSLKR